MFPFLSFLIPSSRIWLEFILDMTIKSIFILGVAFIILLIGKRVSFITRHLVLNLAIVSILLIPLFSYFLPKWEIPLLPSVFPQETSAVSFEGTENLEAPKQNLKQEVIADSHSSRTKNNGRTKNDINWPAWLFMLWLVGATGVFAWTMAGIIGTRIIVKKACPVKDRTLSNLALSSTKKMGIKRKIMLLQSQKNTVPLTCGWLHPIIVLPEETESWPMKRKEIVLLHELAHIKRADFLLNLITLSASIIYWFNPLVWIALRQLNIERERASDDHVLALGTKCSEYALHLVEIAKRLSSMKWLSPTRITMAKKSNLEVRIMSILSNKKPSIRIKPLTLVFIGFLAISLVMPISSLHTWAQEKEKPKEALPVKEAVKKALKEFYRLIESMDFSHAMKFLAKLPDLPVFEKYPFVILEKEKDSRTWAILSVKDWKDLDVDSVIKSIEEQPDYFFVTESLTIKGTDKHGKTHILVNNPEHTLILFRKDGKWKITFEGLKTKAIDISKIIKETDEEKGSKKIGIAFTSEGINYIIMESKPLLKVGKPFIIKVKKGTELKDEESKIVIDVAPNLKKAIKIDVAAVPHVMLDKCHALKVNVSPLIIFEGKPALKLDDNFVIVLDKKHAVRLNIKPMLINIRKEILEKTKEKKKKKEKQNLTVQNA